MGKIEKDTTRSKAILSKVKIDEGGTLHIGLDTHKRKYVVVIWLNALAREERFRKNAEPLQTVPGVGSLTAMAFLLELPSPERLAGPRRRVETRCCYETAIAVLTSLSQQHWGLCR